MTRPPSYARARALHETAPASCEAFSVFSWNLLADGLADSGGFLGAPVESLRWDLRREKILEQVLGGEGIGRPDLILLQELDRYSDVEPTLNGAGYTSAWVGKSAERDGCCVAFHRERFSLRWLQPLRYLDAKGRNATQVALLAALDDIRTGTPLLVATTHLKAKSGFESERERQARQLKAAGVEALAGLGSDAALVIGGDFNDTPDSLARAVMRSGGLLESAYVRCLGSEPDWTTWKVRAQGEVCRTIDYIFCSADLRPTAVLLPPPREVIEPERLPGWRYPSDHLSLLARFERAVR